MNIDPKSLQPLAGYVLVEPSEKSSKTQGGIYLPDNAGDKPTYGTVIATGNSIWESGIKEITSPVKVGDKVVYKKWGGNDVKINGIEYQFLKFDDILATIK